MILSTSGQAPSCFPMFAVLLTVKRLLFDLWVHKLSTRSYFITSLGTPSCILIGMEKAKSLVCLYCICFWMCMLGLIYYMLHDFNTERQSTLYNIWKSKLKGEINGKKGFLQISPASLIYFAENCNLKDSLRQGQFLLYRPILYIQQWIYTLNEMEGREMLKSPSTEVLSTGAWYKKTPNDNLHTLATARLSGHMSVWCQVWEEYKKDIGSKSTSVSTFLLKT